MRDEYADFLLSAFQSLEREIRKRGDRRYHQGEDLIQQLWVKLLEHRPRLNSPRKQILRMAANLGCDMDRRERLRRHAPLQDGAYERSVGGDALTNLVDHEDLEHLRRAIHKLRPRQHEAITAHYWREETDRDAAERLSIPVNTLRTRRKAGMKRLKKELGAPNRRSVGRRRPGRSDDRDKGDQA